MSSEINVNEDSKISWNANEIFSLFIFAMKQTFLASINSSSAELKFPSAPFPLLGFHGWMR